MAASQQRINRLKVVKLKGLVDLDISFEEKNVTAILGPNGNGKSTILHVLASAFRPNEIGEDYRFSNFFLPHPDAVWQGSELQITHGFRDGATVHADVVTLYAKRQDRWSPRYEARPRRDVFYIGVDKCVPLIESEKKRVRVNYITRATDEEVIITILQKASFVLNRQYTTLNLHDAGRGKTFIGVVVNGLQYSALSMSAGEQKIFYILDKLYRAKKHSLILVDEIDLLLHDMALKRLIEVICERAEEKSIQVVFTTHRESIVSMANIINIRHIVTRPGRSLCFDETRPDAITRLTGVQLRPLEVFVEDDLATTVVRKVASEIGLSRYVSVCKYGAAINCFTTVGGLLLGGEQCESSLFVLDGDVYRSSAEKEARINAVITGHDEGAVQKRASSLQKIVQLSLPEGMTPEKHVHSSIMDLYSGGTISDNEIAIAAANVIGVADSHEYISRTLDQLGHDRLVGLAKIVDLFAETPVWHNYTAPVRGWLESKRGEISEASI